MRNRGKFPDSAVTAFIFKTKFSESAQLGQRRQILRRILTLTERRYYQESVHPNLHIFLRYFDVQGLCAAESMTEAGCPQNSRFTKPSETILGFEV
jgi:hypothetical protein